MPGVAAAGVDGAALCSEDPQPARSGRRRGRCHQPRHRFSRTHHRSDRRVAESSFSASWHGSPPLDLPRNCTHQLSTPGAGRSGGRACRAGGVTPGQKRVVPFDVRIGDRRAAFGGQLPARGPGCRTRTRRTSRRSPGAPVPGRIRLPRQHVLADGAAVGTNHVVGGQRFLDGGVEQKSAAIIDVAVAAVGIGYARMRPSRGTADGRRTSCNDCRRCDRRDSNLIDTPTHRT